MINSRTNRLRVSPPVSPPPSSDTIATTKIFVIRDDFMKNGVFLALAISAALALEAGAQPSDQDFQSAPAAVNRDSPYTLDGVIYEASFAGSADKIFIHNTDIGVYLTPNFLSFASQLGQAISASVKSADGSAFKFNGMKFSGGNCNGCSGNYTFTPYLHGGPITAGSKTVAWDRNGPAATLDVSSDPNWAYIDQISITDSTRPGGWYMAIDDLSFSAPVIHGATHPAYPDRRHPAFPQHVPMFTSLPLVATVALLLLVAIRRLIP